MDLDPEQFITQAATIVPSPVSVWWLAIIFCAAIGFFVFSLHADKCGRWGRIKYSAQMIMACILCHLFFWQLVSHSFRIFRVVRESPSYIETAIKMGESGLYFDTLLRSEDRSPDFRQFLQCTWRAVEYLSSNSKNCTMQPHCEKYQNGASLTRIEWSELLTDVTKHKDVPSLAADCSGVNFSKF